MLLVSTHVMHAFVFLCAVCMPACFNNVVVLNDHVINLADHISGVASRPKLPRAPYDLLLHSYTTFPESFLRPLALRPFYTCLYTYLCSKSICITPPESLSRPLTSNNLFPATPIRHYIPRPLIALCHGHV